MFHIRMSACRLDMKMLGQTVCTLVILIDLPNYPTWAFPNVYSHGQCNTVPVSLQHNGHCFELRNADYLEIKVGY